LHHDKGDFAKYFTCFAELRQVAKKITNKQMGKLIIQFVDAKQFQAQRLDSLADKEFRQLLESLEKAIGKRHYLYTLIELEYAHFLFEFDLYEQAEKKFLELETTYRSAYGGDALGLADITYQLSRSISRGMEKSGLRTSDPQRYREQGARALLYGRAAYVHSK